MASAQQCAYARAGCSVALWFCFLNFVRSRGTGRGFIFSAPSHALTLAATHDRFAAPTFTLTKFSDTSK